MMQPKITEERFEKVHRRCQGDVHKIALALGCHKSSVYKFRQRYGYPPPTSQMRHISRDRVELLCNAIGTKAVRAIASLLRVHHSTLLRHCAEQGWDDLLV
jgi:hypothetical protein